MIMIALLGTATAILLSVYYYFLFVKRKTTTAMSSSYEDNRADGDDHTSSSSDAYITHLPDGEIYEVFLSFRGEDTRKGFTDHLYNRLMNAGVWVFRDNEALHVGEEIGPKLDKAIRGSNISIPIISPYYASSKWCLRELVHILECKKATGQVVLPIFYELDPSSIRNQTGTFETAFRLHEKKYGLSSKVVQDWRKALAEVASLKGWESSKIADGHEAPLVEIVVTKVLNELRKATLIVTNCLVGAEGHKENILKMVEGKESSDAQAIVIHGMGGVGKTTLAKVIYNHLSTSFKHCCYLPNIRERLMEQKCGPEELQKQLISNILGQQWPNKISHVDEGINIMKDRLKEKKVLILFDDVDCTDQLNALARERSWFKSGSILIITTRNKDVLNVWEERLTYELNGLDYSLSFQLFCRHAFRRDECPSLEFRAIAMDIVSTTGGLPLAIEVIGSMLLGKPKVHWEGIYKKLQKIPHEDVQKKLRITYDALNYEQKQIFLDIACLSIHHKIDFAFYMWDDCEFFPEEGLEKLISWSLIKMGEKKQLTIHDQLRDLGRAIVREEDISNLGNRSRLWNKDDVVEVIKKNQGTEKIQALSLSAYDNISTEDRDITSEQFKNLTNLKFLRLGRANLVGDFKNLLLDLRWLQWSPDTSVPSPTNFHPVSLLILELSHTRITEQWEGWAQIELAKKLKVLNLESCSELKSTPDFSAFKELEILILGGCGSLREVHPSICYLNKTLLTLEFSGQSMETLPNLNGLSNLKKLVYHDAFGRWNRVLNIASLNSLESLSIFGTDDRYNSIENIGLILDLPSSLKEVHLERCQTLQTLPSLSNCNKLSSLQIMQCNNLSKLGNLGDTVTSCKITQCDALESLPHLSSAKNLDSLAVKNCKNLMEIQGLEGVECLRVLQIYECPSLERLGDLSHLEMLTVLQLLNCKKLSDFDGIENSSSLRILEIVGCNPKIRFLDLSRLKKLKFLKLGQLEILTEITMLQKLKHLKILLIFFCNSLENVPDISLFTNLEEVQAHRCEKLTEINGPREQKNLKKLIMCYCNSLERLPDISLLPSLEEVRIDECEKLREIKGLKEQKNLKKLIISCCNSLEKLPDISLLPSLKEVWIDRCKKLTEIKWLKEQANLKKFIISCCNSLSRLSDVSLFTSLEEMYVDKCEKLAEIKGLKEQKKLWRLRIFECNSLKDLSDLSLFENLKKVAVTGCEKLTMIKGLPKNLMYLDICRCKSLENLPDFSGCHLLKELCAEGCDKLRETRGLENLKNFRRLAIFGCKSLRISPDLPEDCILNDQIHMREKEYDMAREISLWKDLVDRRFEVQIGKPFPTLSSLPPLKKKPVDQQRPNATTE